MYNSSVHVPLYIGGEEITTSTQKNINPPHDHKHVLGQYSFGTTEHVNQAIDAALAARPNAEGGNLDCEGAMTSEALIGCAIQSWPPDMSTDLLKFDFKLFRRSRSFFSTSSSAFWSCNRANVPLAIPYGRIQKEKEKH